MKRLQLALIALLFYCSSCDNPPATDIYQKRDTERVKGQLRELMEEHKVPGLQFYAFSEKEEISFSLGFAQMADSILLKPTDKMEIASLSKPLFAELLFTLDKQGLFDLNKPLKAYFPSTYPIKEAAEKRYRSLSDYMQQDSNWLNRAGSLTAVQLLSHQGGFSNWWEDELRFAGDTGVFRYSDEHYLFLQRLVEHHLKSDLASLWHEASSLKRGKETACCTKACSSIRNIAGYDSEGNFARNIWLSEEALAHGTVLSNAGFYANFMRDFFSNKSAYLPQGHGLKPLVQTGETNIGWTLGWGIETTDIDTIYWHWGNDIYFQSIAFYSSRYKRGLVMMTNSENGLDLINEFLQESYPQKLKFPRFVLP